MYNRDIRKSYETLFNTAFRKIAESDDYMSYLRGLL